jgi:hypothetical protein
MVATDLYIVDFHSVVWKFKKVVADPEIPTIDGDQIKYAVLNMFIQVDPLSYLDYIATEMVKDDYLFSKEEYFEVTPEAAQEQDRWLRSYLREAVLDLGRSMYQELKNMGMLRTGLERYQVTNRPLTDDTYLLKRVRPPA